MNPVKPISYITGCGTGGVTLVVCSLIAWLIGVIIRDGDPQAFSTALPIIIFLVMILTALATIVPIFIGRLTTDVMVKKNRKEQELQRECETVEQMFEKNDLVELCRCSTVETNSLILHLQRASKLLNAAEFEFSETAYAPFWDQIENAASELGAFRATVNTLHENAQLYKKKQIQFRNELPEFPIPKIPLPNPKAVIERFHAIVRLAQRDAEFSKIYELRKTNKILIEGFGTLASAIASLESSMVSAIGQLALTVESQMESIMLTIEEQNEILGALNHHEPISSDPMTGIQKELGKQSEMLDNIQRDRKPPW